MTSEQEWRRLKERYHVQLWLTRFCWTVMVLMFVFADFQALQADWGLASFDLTVATACFLLIYFRPQLIEIKDEDLK